MSTVSDAASTMGESVEVHHTFHSNLPAVLTELVGRTAELDHISRLINMKRARLLVLTGPGGVGKTRLAIAAANHLGSQFADGAVFIDLSPTSADDLVLPTIASALGVRAGAPDTLLHDLIQALQSRSLLIVIDNFEQVVDAAPSLTEILLTCPDVVMIVTSRAVLDVYGAAVVPVQPLGVPTVRDRELESIAEFDAVQLFVRRVQAIRPDFELHERNVADVVKICTRLDGIPLAIELAAARTSIYTIAVLADRLQRRLRELDSGPQDVTPRLRTMRGAISWSYDLLSDTEQRVFRHLSMFTGQFNLESALAMMFGTITPDAEDEALLMEAVGSLVDKSLVQRVEAIDHDRNFRILQIIREFGVSQLEESGEWPAARERFMAYIEDVVRRAEPHLIGREQVWWLNQLELLTPDAVRVLERLEKDKDYERMLELATSMWRYGYARGNVAETRQWILRALTHTSGNTVLRARALNAVGVLSNMLGDMDATRQYQQEALDIAREVGSIRQEAIACFGLGDAAVALNRLDDAERYYLESERLYTQLDDGRGIATAQTNLGNLYWQRGRLADALKIHEASRRLYESVGDQRGLAWAFTNVGRISAELHEWAHAASNLTQAIELYDLIGDRTGLAESYEACAQIAAGGRDFDRAARLLGAADRLRELTGHPVPVSDQREYELCLSTVKSALGTTFSAAFEAGRKFRRAQSVALATSLHVPEDSGPTIDRKKKDVLKVLSRHAITERELDVLERLGNGDGDRDIAASLFISTRTVQSHVQNLLNKLEASSRSAAVAKAFRLGILE